MHLKVCDSVSGDIRIGPETEDRVGATEEGSVLNLQSQAELSTLKLDSIGLNSATYGWFEN